MFSRDQQTFVSVMQHLLVDGFLTFRLLVLFIPLLPPDCFTRLWGTIGWVQAQYFSYGGIGELGHVETGLNCRETGSVCPLSPLPDVATRLFEQLQQSGRFAG